MFRFWYRFVPENMPSISRGLTDFVCQKIAPKISVFMGGVFEDICKQYLWALAQRGESVIPFQNLERWWGNDPQHKCKTEIDIMGTDGDNAALYAECKWTNEKIDIGVLDTLVERSHLFHYTKKYYYFFSKSGFTSGCIEKAKQISEMRLLSFDEMLKQFV